MRKSWTPEYGAWTNAKQRCANQRHPLFPLYGGRGVKVCSRWRHSFDNFLEDMGPRPSSKHSLDRIDVNGDYTPKNCRWATKKTQSNNRRDNHFLEFEGKRKTVAQWARRTGLQVETIRFRLRQGWSVDRVLSTPPQKKRTGLIAFKDKELSIAEWARASSVSTSRLRRRLDNGLKLLTKQEWKQCEF